MDFLHEKEMRLEQLMPIIQEALSQGKNIKFSPRGISMLPMIRQGKDSVILSPAPQKLKKYDLPLYQREQGKYILHRVVQAGETYTCIGDNQFELESGIRHDQIIALVTVFIRDGKVISVKSPAYRLYCRVWHHTRGIRHFYRRGKGWIRRHLK